MSKTLTEEQIRGAAVLYGVEYAALRAVIEVESGGSGFANNRHGDEEVKILFERHILWKRLQIPGRDINPKPLATAHPSLCGPSWSPKQYPYGPTSLQWDRVETVVAWAQKRDPNRWESYKKAAYESASYGLFQLMGYHYEAAGYHEIYNFKHAMEADEESQLKAIIRWMRGNGLLERLRSKDWTRFVMGYNGIGQVPVYRAKLLKAYSRYV